MTMGKVEALGEYVCKGTEAIKIRSIPQEDFAPAPDLVWQIFSAYDASSCAVPVYRKPGFRETDCEQEVNGIRFTPMLYKGNTI